MIEYTQLRSRGPWTVGALSAAALAVAACATGTTDTQGTAAGSGGGSALDGGAGGVAGQAGTGGGDTGGSNTGGSNAGGSAGSVANDAGDGAPASARITEIADGTIPEGTAVTVQGAVVMSHVFLISKSNSTNSCLWGVFVSEPGLTETAPYSGILVLSYGSEATADDGGTSTYCPMLGVEPTGSGIPDDLGPGDVVDISGKTAYYLPSTCTQAGDSQTKSRQLGQATVTRTGTGAPIPAAHAVSAQEIVQLASPTAGDQGFHDQWGGVKVRVTNVTAVPQTVGSNTSVTNAYGEIILQEGNLAVGDKIYYRGYSKTTDVCYAGPTYSNASQSFSWIDGFGYLNYCTWGLQAGSKCNDLNPSSEDCSIGSGDPATVCTHD